MKKSFKKKAFNPAGLFLWSVEVDGWDSDLWVTTEHKSMPIAAAKAQRVARQYAGLNCKKFVSINKITDRGYIDA